MSVASPRNRWLIYALAALVATYLTHLVRTRPLPAAFDGLTVAVDYLQLPAFLVSALLSGNVHYPSPTLYHSLVFGSFVLGFAILDAATQRYLKYARSDA